MATTTNYSWTTPDDTALVKDGAAAIRTLGSSVDTTTKNLNPSTTLGDIEYRSSTANTNTRLGIGTTGQVLTVSGGVPAWSTPGATSFTGCRIFNSTTQTINNATVTTLTFDSEVYDTSNFHSTSTNTSRITIPTGLGGYYALQASIYFSIGNGAGTRACSILKNGTRIFGMDISGQTDQTLNFGNIANLVAGDYLEFTAYQTTGSQNGAYGDAAYTYLSAQFLGA
jgi:hypothetical protein